MLGALPIFGMDKGSNLVVWRISLCGIEAEYAEHLRRPVFANIGRLVRPTSHSGKSLRLRHVGFAQPQATFNPLSILDIDTRSKPFENLSLLVAQRDFVVQHPAVLSIGPPHPCFMQKWLPTG